MNKQKFKTLLIRHKRLIAKLGKTLLNKQKEDFTEEELTNLLVPVKKSGRELVLVRSGFKCEKTGVENNLQFHHLIDRKDKELMSYGMYQTQRNFWANIVILSQEHHENNFSPESVITENTINKLKKKYSFEE